MASLLSRLGFFFLLSVVFYSKCFAQPQANNWYFSPYHGLNFSTGKGVYQTGGQMPRMEGGACISDDKGQLLFYTDGVDVWNRNHANMQNGTGLEGGYGSTTQSCIIVPKTQDGLQYYIFTADEQAGSMGFKYSIVDLAQNGGLGAVVQKNIPLLFPTCEKITAVRHCNKKDYWVITHKYDSDEYYAYLAGENGIDPNPVISKAGSMIASYYYNWNAAGQLKSSPDGKKLAAANSNNGIDLLDFDNQTGIVSNGVELFGNDNGAHYGVEFSSNSKILYAAVKGYFNASNNTRYTSLFQYDLSLPSSAAIKASQNSLLTYTGPNDETGSLQRGPDKRIYLAHYYKPYLSVVNRPDSMGAASNFEEKGILLPGNGRFNLPNMLNEYGYAQTDSFTVSSNAVCVGSTLQFNYTPVSGISSLKWDFSDPASGAANNSVIENPTHQFKTAGTYTVQLIKYGPCSNDTLKKLLTISSIDLSLGKDTLVCDQTPVTLSPAILTGTPTQYLWQDGSSQSSFQAKAAGLYWVELSNNTGCRKRDSILVNYKPYPVVSLGPDQNLCKGKSLILDAGNSGSRFLWQDGSTQQQFRATASGRYQVAVDLNGCSKTDELIITEALPPQFSLGADLEICAGEQIELNPKLSNVTYQWQDGSTNPTLVAVQPGQYILKATNLCGSNTDTLLLKLVSCEVSIPNAFTPNGDGRNELFRIRGGSSLEFFQMEVFNRWGQRVFSSHQWQTGWDGTINGKPADSGSFVYLIRCRKRGETTNQVKKGSFLLIR